MYISNILETCIIFIFLGLAVIMWYFFKSIEVQLKGIQATLKEMNDTLWKFQKSLR